MKQLSELIEASWPIDYEVSPYGKTLCDRASYERMKRVAIELSRACVAIESSRKNKINPTSVRRIARIALLSAKDIIGEVK